MADIHPMLGHPDAPGLDLPDVGAPAIPSGPQISPGLPWANQAADIGSRLFYGALSGLGQAAMAPGEAYQSTTPITTDQMIAPAANLAGAVTLGAGAAPAEADALRMGIKAYHGSPHDFDAFDMSKIGTGEGAQAYGHGLYFAGNEDVAKTYKAAGPASNNLGNMYEVEINADPDQFLDWDKPLTAQPDNVKSALKAIGVDVSDPSLNDKIAAAQGLRLHPPQPSQGYPVSLPGIKSPAAARAFSSRGVPGIKYLDQGSRAAGEGSRNYVLFDANLVNILRKYGLAGLPFAGAASSPIFANSNNQPGI